MKVVSHSEVWGFQGGGGNGWTAVTGWMTGIELPIGKIVDTNEKHYLYEIASNLKIKISNERKSLQN